MRRLWERIILVYLLRRSQKEGNGANPFSKMYDIEKYRITIVPKLYYKTPDEKCQACEVGKEFQE